ncbi:hypothetical protein KEJ18_03870 [Candidatus Bathyarchaeota archaeon]|nr:hypothetical protein [Candidatus Bathyarchaeota archaeon]
MSPPRRTQQRRMNPHPSVKKSLPRSGTRWAWASESRVRESLAEKGVPALCDDAEC